MKDLFKTAGALTPALSQAFEKVHQACDVCAQNGRPAIMRTVSIKHVNKEFNEEVQADFFWCTIREKRYIVFNITDTNTSYSEVCIATNRSVALMTENIENNWICRHGAPAAFSADYELDKAALRRFLSRHGIEFSPRPSRRHNKVGVVERKNGTIKRILSKLENEPSSAAPEALIIRANFLSNLFSGSKVLSSFQLARGYSPSLLGLPRTLVTPDLLDAHREQVALRALQRLLKARKPNTVPTHVLQPGTPIWVFFDSSKQNETARWVSAKVVEAQQHMVLARRSSKGPPMKVAYEDLRLAPSGELTRELLAGSLEETLEEHTVSATPPKDTDNSGSDETGGELHLNNQQSMFHPTLLSRRVVGDAEKDTGTVHVTDKPPPAVDLTSEKQRILKDVYEEIGTSQVAYRRLEFAPSWLIEEAFAKEHDDNWADAYELVDYKEMPKHANVISSHVVYKIKKQDDEMLILKARLVPHGNNDNDKDSIRKDSSTAQFHVIRLLLSIATFIGLRLGTADISGAYLQSGPIKRTIFVRPPREWRGDRSKIWKLTKLPYGIVEAGRQWQKVIERWMLDNAKLDRVVGVSQLYVKRIKNGHITLLVAKVTDDVLIAGSNESIRRFAGELKQDFKVSRITIDEPFFFNGSYVEQDQAGNVSLSMRSYITRLKPIELSRMRKKQNDDVATAEERTRFKSLAGTINFLGSGVLPQASFVASSMQQKTGRLLVRNIREANAMVSELTKLTPVVFFPRLQSEVSKACVYTFSDASFNIGASQSYGQSGLVTGISAQSANGDNVYHIIDWSSHKQRRVSHSSYGAEILACADADDRGFHLRDSILSLFPASNARHVLHVDSRGLYETITTLHDGKEYRLRQTVERIRNSFDSGELDVLRWIPGKINIADALTKRNIVLYRMLNKIATTGKLSIDVHHGYELHSRTWN